MRQEGFDFQNIVGILLRRWYLFLGALAACGLLGLVIYRITPVRFRSDIRILLSNTRGGTTQNAMAANTEMATLSSLLTGINRDIATQKEILQSPVVIAEAAKTARVSPEFLKVEAKDIKDTDIITVVMTAPTTSDLIALSDTLPSTFQKYIESNRKSGLRKGISFIEERLAAENRQLVKAQNAMARFKRTRNVVLPEAEREMRMNQEFTLQNDIQKQEATLRGTQATLTQLVEAKKRLPTTITTPTVSTNQTEIGVIQDRLEMLKNQRAALLIRLKPTATAVREVDAQVEDMRRRLAKTPKTMTMVVKAPNPDLLDYDKQIGVANASIVSLSAEIARKRLSLASVSKVIAQYNTLDNEYQTLRANVQRHADTANAQMTMLRQLELQEQSDQNEIQIVSPLSAPVYAGLTKKQITILSLLLGILLGALVATIIDRMDDRIYNPEMITDELQSTVIAYIPEVTDNFLIYPKTDSYNLQEAYRVFRSNVKFGILEELPWSLLVTSSLPGEGKTVTSVNLAASLAQAGYRVILVDADLRRPTVHKKLNIGRHPGLSNVLIGQCTIDEALQETAIPQLLVLPSGNLPPNPAEVLSSESMQRVHQQLLQHADVVLYDSSPVLATADPLILSGLVSKVIVVSRTAFTRMTAIRATMEMLQQAKASIMGVVLNRVEVAPSRLYQYVGAYKYRYANYYRYRAYQYSAYQSDEPDTIERLSQKELAAEFENLPRLREARNGTPPPLVGVKGEDSQDKES